MIGLGLGVGCSGMIDRLYAYARADALAYRNLIIADGGSISDSDFADVLAFARSAYRIARSRVDFWSLRSIHNIGTGSKAISFYGVVGTLINGPTWGGDGIVFNRANWQYITTTTPLRLPFTAIAVSFSPTGSTYPAIWGNENQGGSTANMNLYLNHTTGGRPNYTFGGGTVGGSDLNSTVAVINTWNSLAVASGGPGGTAQLYQGAGVLRASGTAPAAQLNIGNFRFGGSNAGSMNGTIAFHMQAPVQFTAAQISSLYTAYKQTLGKGLGLP